MKTLVSELAVVLLFAVTACGEGSDKSSALESATSQRERAEKKAADELEAEVAARRAAKTAEHKACAAAVKPLRDALGQVDSRLGVGLTYADYGERLGDAQVHYDALLAKLDNDIDTVGTGCLDAAIPLEKALNAYIKVNNSWGDCIDSYPCDFSEGEPNRKAQAGWAKAKKAIANSDRKLAGMSPAVS